MADRDQQHIFDKPGNVKRLLYALYILAAVLVVIDLIIHRHILHPWERLIGFYPIYGFIGIVILVFASIGLRKLVMRREDYYDE